MTAGSTVAVTGLEHIGLVTPDTESLADWYALHFGARRVSASSASPPIIFVSFGGGALVELIPGDDSERPSERVHLCLTVADVTVAISQLTAAGVELAREPFAAYDGSEVAFVRDPAGHLVQVVARTAGSEIHSAVYGPNAAQ